MIGKKRSQHLSIARASRLRGVAVDMTYRPYCPDARTWCDCRGLSAAACDGLVCPRSVLGMRLGSALAGCCMLLAGCASAVASDHHAARLTSRDEKPRMLSVAYGKVRPNGATSAFYALSIRASDPDGQIVSWTYRQLVESGVSAGAVSDGGCGLGGRRNGHVYASPLPIKKLRGGIYRFRITVAASTCTRHARGESASRTFTIHIR